MPETVADKAAHQESGADGDAHFRSKDAKTEPEGAVGASKGNGDILEAEVTEGVEQHGKRVNRDEDVEQHDTPAMEAIDNEAWPPSTGPMFAYGDTEKHSDGQQEVRDKTTTPTNEP